MTKEELLEKVKEAKLTEELDELRSQISKLETKSTDSTETKDSETVEDDKTEDTEKKEEEITQEEERSLVRETTKTNEVETRNFVKTEIRKEDKKMEKEERTLSDVLKSKEYKSAWAKTLMGRKLNKKEEEARAAGVGGSITTTDTEFVAAADGVQGINNGGLFIPTDVRLDMLKIIEEQSPFLRDVRKLAVSSNIDMPYLNASDDAEWYAELTDTKNEGQEYRKISLTGYELAKQIEITWKLEAMSVSEFLSFITRELANKMGRALATAVLYGDGKGKPTGALNGLTAIEGPEVIAAMLNTYSSLKNEMKIGAKAYLSTALAVKVVSFKDANGNYPYLQGLTKTALFAIEVDPYLNDTDMIVGNASNYVLNTVEAISVNRETKVTQRRNIYSTYAIYDGKAYPDAFAKGKVNEA